MRYGVVGPDGAIAALRADRPARPAAAARHGDHRASLDPDGPAADQRPGGGARRALQAHLRPRACRVASASSPATEAPSRCAGSRPSPCFIYHSVNALRGGRRGRDRRLPCEAARSRAPDLDGPARADAELPAPRRSPAPLPVQPAHRRAPASRCSTTTTASSPRSTRDLSAGRRRYAYNMHISPEKTLLFDGLMKYDVDTGRRARRTGSGTGAGAARRRSRRGRARPRRTTAIWSPTCTTSARGARRWRCSTPRDVDGGAAVPDQAAGARAARLPRHLGAGRAPARRNRRSPDNRLSAVLGLWQDRDPLEALETARLADELGYPSLWMGEMATFDAFALGERDRPATERIALTVGPARGRRARPDGDRDGHGERGGALRAAGERRDRRVEPGGRRALARAPVAADRDPDPGRRPRRCGRCLRASEGNSKASWCRRTATASGCRRRRRVTIAAFGDQRGARCGPRRRTGW